MNHEEASKLMRLNAVKLRIYPIANLRDDPMSDWDWNVEIVIPNNQWAESDEDGNFYVNQHGIDSFHTIDSAFRWAFSWLKGRGYYIDDFSLETEIIKTSDLERSIELMKREWAEQQPLRRRTKVTQ